MCLAVGLEWCVTKRLLDLGPLTIDTLLNLFQDVGRDAFGGVHVDIDLVERHSLLRLHVTAERFQGEVAALLSQPAEVALAEIGRVRACRALHDELLQDDLADGPGIGDTARSGCDAAVCGNVPSAPH